MDTPPQAPPPVPPPDIIDSPTAPIVGPTDKCNVHFPDGTRCANATGTTKPGVDADLCRTHRLQMAALRRQAEHDAGNGP